ncbi:MAG: hypothetical protein MK135_07535, partial [Polyangiaceae bacterium]|nr:hypothetical protein [Polyangiaceae bacterium]
MHVRFTQGIGVLPLLLLLAELYPSSHFSLAEARAEVMPARSQQAGSPTPPPPSIQKTASSKAKFIRWDSIRWKEGHATGKTHQGKLKVLGLDQRLQRELKRLLKRARPLAGAATLIDARSGQVLAAAEIGESHGSLLFDPIAPAASVFKLVTTAALYENSPLTPGQKICTQGGQRRIERRHLMPASGPEAICSPFAQALGVSRNAAFAQLATNSLMREQ